MGNVTEMSARSIARHNRRKIGRIARQSALLIRSETPDANRVIDSSSEVSLLPLQADGMSLDGFTNTVVTAITSVSHKRSGLLSMLGDHRELSVVFQQQGVEQEVTVASNGEVRHDGRTVNEPHPGREIDHIRDSARTVKIVEFATDAVEQVIGPQPSLRQRAEGLWTKWKRTLGPEITDYWQNKPTQLPQKATT